MSLHLRRALGTTALVALAGALALPAAADQIIETDHHQVRVETVAEGLEHPWGLALLPDGRFLVTERNPGNLRIFTTGGKDYSDAPIGVGTEMEGMTSAVHYFEETVAPSGLLIYSGEMFPKWQGHLLNGGLAAEALVRVALAGDEVVEEEWMLGDLERRIRDVVQADDGSIWLITEHEDGEVLRLSAADEPATD